MRPLRWHWRRWRRRVPFFWMLSVALAGVTGLAVFRMVGAASAAAAQYGSLVRVPVVARSVSVGSVVGGDDVTWRRVPRAFVPAHAAHRPVGAVAVAPLVVGEVVVEDRLAPAGLRGAAAVVVARTAVVVEVDHDRVTVAVPAADAPTVAYALTRGAVTLALVGAAP